MVSSLHKFMHMVLINLKYSCKAGFHARTKNNVELKLLFNSCILLVS